MGLPEKIDSIKVMPILSMDEKKALMKRLLLNELDSLRTKGLYHKSGYRNAHNYGTGTIGWNKNYHYKELLAIRKQIWELKQLLDDLK
jgi:hypothetical protein